MVPVLSDAGLEEELGRGKKRLSARRNGVEQKKGIGGTSSRTVVASATATSIRAIHLCQFCWADGTKMFGFVD